MKKNFLFVNLSVKCGFNTGINHGIAYLVPIVRKFGYNVSCFNVQKEISEDAFVKVIDGYSPSIVAFSLPSQQLKYLSIYSKAIKKHGNILQIAGGVGPTLEPELFLSKTCVDGVCRGEGENPISNLFGLLSEGKPVFEAKGFYWNKNPGTVKNSIPDFVKDLDTVALPDYSVFDQHLFCCSGSVSVMISRGCPNNCYYCCNDALRSVYSCHGYFRLPSVSRSIELLGSVRKQSPGVKYFAFEDDLLTADKKWFLEFSREYKSNIGLPYRICARTETLSREIVDALKDSGCQKVSIGLENGNEDFRKKMLNRHYSNDVFIEGCRLIKSAGIELFTFNIVGFPFETVKEMKETLELNKKIKPNAGLCTFFYPYKNTQLYKICETSGLLEKEDVLKDITNYNTKPSIRMGFKQRKNCLNYHKKIRNYLFKRAYFTELNKLPRSRNRLVGFIYYSIWYFVHTRPFLYRLYQRFKPSPNF